MINKLKQKFAGNYKKAAVMIIAFYCIKGTLMLFIGGYLHAKGYTNYLIGFVVLLLALIVGKILWKRRGE